MNKKILIATLLALALFHPSPTHAGTWGVGAFGNDTAADWVWELEESEGYRLLRSTLNDVLRPGYLEAPEASEAIAAAEVVAALFGQPGSDLPAGVVTWVGQQANPDPNLKPLALKALRRIRNGEGSELQELWADSSDYGDWLATIDNLIHRLK